MKGNLALKIFKEYFNDKMYIQMQSHNLDYPRMAMKNYNASISSNGPWKILQTVTIDQMLSWEIPILKIKIAVELFKIYFSTQCYLLLGNSVY